MKLKAEARSKRLGVGVFRGSRVKLAAHLRDDNCRQGGYIRRQPRILAVQSAACAPIHQAWLRNDPAVTDVEPCGTWAEGVALPDPPRGTQVLHAIRRHDGAMLSVDDDALLSCWRDMARMGICMEPTSAVAVAGAWRARESRDPIKPADSVLILITGHGLKTAPKLMNAA